MSKLEEIGRDYLMNRITALEGAEPGLSPMFYFTGSFHGDIGKASAMREEHDMPRPQAVQDRIDDQVVVYRKRRSQIIADRDNHRHKMKTDWWYWIAVKIGLIKCRF